jgi:hypothetical protein
MRIADPLRLPVDVYRLTDPYSWRPEQVTSFRCHIEDGQRQRIPERRIFQFARVLGGDHETTLRVEIARNSELHYDACSRLYVARMLRNDHSDLHAMHEVVNQLPSLGVSRYQPLYEEDFQDARMHAENYTELQYLLHYMEDYEDGAPVQVRGVYEIACDLTILHRQNLAIGRSFGRPHCGSLRLIPRMRRMWIHWADGGYRRSTSRCPLSTASSTACERSQPGSGPGYSITRPLTPFWAVRSD